MVSIKPVNLLEDRIGALLLRLSCPALSGMMLSSGLNLLDTFFVSRLGSAAMAALTICLPVYLLVLALGSATGTGLTSFIARTLGEGNNACADNIAWHGIFISVVYAAVFMWVGIEHVDLLLILFGCTPDIFAMSRQYLMINFLACMFTFPPMLMANIIQGEGDTVIPVVTSLLAMILNVVLDPILIFGIKGVPALGLNGAALAAVFSQVALTLMLIWVILHRKKQLSWSIRNFKPSLKVLAGIYAVALPGTVMEVIGVVVMVSLNRIVAGFGYQSLAVLGIFLRVRSFFYMPVFGLAQGVMPILGFSYGAGRLERVREAIVKSTVASFMLMGLAGVVLQSCPGWMMAIFTPEAILIGEGVRCIKLATMVLPLAGPIIIFSTALQALGKGFMAMCLSLLRQAGLFLPLLILPAYLGLSGVWLAFSVSELISAGIVLIFFLNLWRELQTARKLTLVMLFSPGFLKNRIQAWLRW